MIPPRAAAQSYWHNDIPWQSTASWEANTGHPDQHNWQTNTTGRPTQLADQHNWQTNTTGRPTQLADQHNWQTNSSKSKQKHVNTGHPDQHNWQTNSSKSKQKHVNTRKQMQKSKLISLFLLGGEKINKVNWTKQKKSSFIRMLCWPKLLYRSAWAPQFHPLHQTDLMSTFQPPETD